MRTSLAILLVLLAIGFAEMQARTNQTNLGCFRDGKDMFTKLGALVYEPSRSGGGILYFGAEQGKFRRVVFRRGNSCPAGYEFHAVYDDEVADFTTDPHKAKPKAKPKRKFIRMFDK